MINYTLILKIFNRKIIIKKNSDKIKLSQYTGYIPMYDIYSDSIYPISCDNLSYRLLKCHYRFITKEVKQWIQNKLDKMDKSLEDMIQKYTNNLAIIDCYNLEILEKTSYETLYRYSPDLGLSISICKRNSFHPFSNHLTPYYTKTELIRLGMNNRIIKKLNTSNLIDEKVHYTICKKVSKNDISFTTISNHMDIIIKNECIGWIQYYSMTGSYLFNKILRDKLPINRYMYDGLEKIYNTMNTTLPANYYFYRFVWDDDYISKLKIGSIFTDDGFISTTRDPFYAPGLKKDFGLILIRINIPKKISGTGLLIENFSMFPKEEEYLIKPSSKLKLISKDTTTYYHIDEKFEKLIKKRYEFELIETKTKLKLKILEDIEIPLIDNIKLKGSDRFDLFTNFMKECDEYGQYRYYDKIFITEFFDSTSSYQHLYFNKTKDGMIHTCYHMGSPILSIECSEVLMVNYLKSKCYYDNYTVIPIDELNEIVSMYCKMFGYREAMIYFEYCNFTEFKDNYSSNLQFLSTNLYCKTLYDYIKNKSNHNKHYKFNYGFWQIDKSMKQPIPDEVMNHLPSVIKKKQTWGELFINIVEKYFYLYNKMEDWFNTYHDNLFKKTYYIFNPATYLKSLGYNISDIPTFTHITTRDRGDMYRVIYEDTVRRI